MSYELHSYRKFIPNNFQEVCGQEIPIKILRNIINNIKSPPSLLFSGMFGIGKTILAKLFAKAINCENLNICNNCSNCNNFETSVDILEIDGATYTGVENIRSILMDCQYKPVNLKYKVYIIDEAHMLSKSAFNSLLKTLENPPDHVIFLFATTEIEKIPDTILSRCLVIPLEPLNKTEIKNYINNLIDISEEKLNLAIDNSSGSLREVWSLIDLINLSNETDNSKLQKYLQVLNHEYIYKIFIHILDGNPSLATKVWQEIHSNGYSSKLFFKHISQLLHEISLCIYKISEKHNDLLSKYSITSSLMAQWIDIILKQHISYMNNGDFTVENTIFLMSFIEDQINLTYEAQQAFPNLKITL